MSQKTESELLFEQFCFDNELSWRPYGEEKHRTPDYRVSFDDVAICVELKQIESRRGMEESGRMTRVVGDRIRREITKATEQVQEGARAGFPTLLLVYNAVDPLQAFGTEPHDFMCAMYGELTVRIVDGTAGDSYHGRNARLRDGVNTSFSAIGHLRNAKSGPKLTIYENVYARCPLPYAALPACIEVVRVEVRDAT